MCSLITRHERFEWFTNSVAWAPCTKLTHVNCYFSFKLSVPSSLVWPYIITAGLSPEPLASALGQFITEAHVTVFKLSSHQADGCWCIAEVGTGEANYEQDCSHCGHTYADMSG